MLSNTLKLFLPFQLCNLVLNAHRHPKHIHQGTANMYNNVFMAHFLNERINFKNRENGGKLESAKNYNKKVFP